MRNLFSNLAEDACSLWCYIRCQTCFGVVRVTEFSGNDWIHYSSMYHYWLKDPKVLNFDKSRSQIQCGFFLPGCVARHFERMPAHAISPFKVRRVCAWGGPINTDVPSSNSKSTNNLWIETMKTLNFKQLTPWSGQIKYKMLLCYYVLQQLKCYIAKLFHQCDEYF